MERDLAWAMWLIGLLNFYLLCRMSLELLAFPYFCSHFNFRSSLMIVALIRCSCSFESRTSFDLWVAKILELRLEAADQSGLHLLIFCLSRTFLRVDCHYHYSCSFHHRPGLLSMICCWEGWEQFRLKAIQTRS